MGILRQSSLKVARGLTVIGVALGRVRANHVEKEPSPPPPKQTGKGGDGKMNLGETILSNRTARYDCKN